MNNWHKTPNYIYDAYSEMKEAELRLTVWLVRHTYGFHRGNVQATSKEIQEQTGLSKQGLINAQNAVQERGFFVRVSGGYEVNEVDQKVNEVDPKPTSEGQRSRPSRSTKLTPEVNEVDQIGQLSRPSTSSLKESIKESIKEKERENIYTPPQPVIENSPYEPTEQQLATEYTMQGFGKQHPAFKAFQSFNFIQPGLNKLTIAAHDVTAAGVSPDDIPLFLEYWQKELGNRTSKPYPVQLVNNLEGFKAWLSEKKGTQAPAVTSPALVMGYVEKLRGLQNGAYKAAWDAIPGHIKVVMSQAIKNRGIGTRPGELTIADLEIVILERTN